MPHHQPTPFFKSNPKFSEIKKVLDENDKLLAQTKSIAAQNTNKVLRYLVETMYRVEGDLILLQNKLQPILKSLEEDSDWRSRMPREEHE
jgi:hypothetical protein